MTRLLLILCNILVLAGAYTSFDTKCTLPSGSSQFNYVSSPNTRGTLDIIWSCLFTILSCTWTVQYPDLPRPRSDFAAGRAGWWKWSVRKYASQFGWFLTTILAPEILLAKYAAESVEASRLTKKFQEYAVVDGVEWTRTHCYFADMRGFVIKTHKQAPDYSERSTQTEATAAATTTTTTGNSNHGTSLDGVSPDFLLETVQEQRESIPLHHDHAMEEAKVYPKPQRIPPERCFLGCEMLLALRKAGLLARLPDVPKEEIQDRSKADGFARVITVFQILWLCVQMIARAVGGLAVSQLEVATVAFAICAVFMYILCWDRPKGIQIPITLRHCRDDDAIIQFWLHPRWRGSESGPDGGRSDPESNNWMQRNREFFSPSQIALGATVVLAGSMFGGVHLIAWDFTFPTQVELVLWRVSALYSTCFLAVGVVMFLGGIMDMGLRDGILATFLELIWKLLQVLAGLYVVARLFIVVEMFRTLAFQPRGAYVGTWTANIPYVS